MAEIGAERSAVPRDSRSELVNTVPVELGRTLTLWIHFDLVQPAQIEVLPG
jgi:hypothetical protein